MNKPRMNQEQIIQNSIRDHNAYLLQSQWDRDEIQHLRNIITALVASNGGACTQLRRPRIRRS